MFGLEWVRSLCLFVSSCCRYGDAVVVEGTEQVAWRPVEQCDDITQTVCDVTDQTNDLEEEYYVRVRANRLNVHSEWTETDRRLRLADSECTRDRERGGVRYTTGQGQIYNA